MRTLNSPLCLFTFQFFFNLTDGDIKTVLDYETFYDEFNQLKSLPFL